MPKTVTASEAKNKLGSIVGWVVENQEEVIVESYGEPRVVIMSFDEYEKLKALKEQQRRWEALDQLRRLKAEVSSHNKDLSEGEAMALTDRFVREVIDDMATEGKIRFERDNS
ncbi:MAG: type II toxin-antitoxin system Phd/YefM family antitoxin [Herpetosiphonaceae bacterium]|nr:type II toxin-antitoxin system Phd/YefM family antitoxin [Herpetosiphonaceae bacterium]